MKLLFVHDGPIFQGEDGRYYEYSYHGLLERYSYIADEITFLMRVYPLTANNAGTPVPEEIRVVSVPNFKTPRTYFTQRKTAERIIKEEMQRADCAILRGSSCSSIAQKYAERYHVPYIYECVGCTWDSLWNYSILGKLMAPWSFFQAKKRIRKSPYVYYVTNEFLQKRYPTNGISVGCSNVIIDPISDSVLQNRLTRIDQLQINRTVVLGTAAAIDVRYKGQEYVIRAISELKQEGYQLEYHLAGGNQKNSTYLKDLAKTFGVEDEVIFCGSLNADEMKSFYDSLDVYIQPSKQEGLPRSVIEAMSRGVPCLGSNIAGLPELLTQDCLFRKGDVTAIKECIRRMLNANMKEIAIRNFEKAKEYEADILRMKREKFYDQFVREYGSANKSE